MSIRLPAVAIALLLVPLFAQGQSSTTLADNPVYKEHCAKCHGKNADGRMFAGPSLVSAKVADKSDDELRTVITNGKGRMPKFAGKLSGEEIDNLVRQIKASAKK